MRTLHHRTVAPGLVLSLLAGVWGCDEGARTAVDAARPDAGNPDEMRDGSLPVTDPGSGPFSDADAPPEISIVPYERDLRVNETERVIEACRGVGGSSEACTWSLMYDATLCSSDTPCASLVVMFSGGEMNCDTFPPLDRGHGKVMAAYAEDPTGFVTARACTFETAQEGTHGEAAPRVDELVRTIAEIYRSSARWSGENLLVTGISTGATSPTVTIGTTDLEEGWLTPGVTAACMMDGTMSAAASVAHYQSHSEPAECRLPWNANCQRYGEPDFCDPAALAESAAEDDLTRVRASAFGLRDWKLIECGSQLPVCGPGTMRFGFDVDWSPAAPIETVCDTLADSPDHTCSFVALAREGHSQCFWSGAGIRECKDWFEELLGR